MTKGSIKRKHQTGFTLAEVVVSIAIVGILFTGIMSGYLESANVAEWSGYSLAAQAIAAQQVEVTRAAQWDPNEAVDQISLVPTSTVVRMDLPVSGTNFTYATNFLEVSTVEISTVPPVKVKAIISRTVWSFRNRKVFTNTVITYRAPDA